MNEYKIKKDLEVIETINIELDYKVSKLIAENEHWKRIFKKRTKNKAKTTKPSTGWKRQSQIEAKVSQSQKVNPDKVKSQPSEENTT
ncbi:hypothetical protein Tco_1098332 [Tanacetum coccineum]